MRLGVCWPCAVGGSGQGEEEPALVLSAGYVGPGGVLPGPCVFEGRGRVQLAGDAGRTPHMLVPTASCLAVLLAVLGTPQRPSEPGRMELDRWSDAAPMAFERSAHALASDGGYAYVVGGVGGAGADPVSAVERFDGRMWATITTLPGVGLNAPAVVMLESKLYVIGGFRTTTNTPHDRVRVYAPETGVWSQVASLPSARGGHAAAVLDGKIHVVGGGNALSTIADHSVYDPATDTWSELAPLPRAEGSPAAVVYQDALWVIGGRSGFNDFGDVYIYDAVHDRWDTGPSIPARGTHGAAVIDGTIYLFGGESQANGSVLDEVLRLDPATMTWQRREPMPTPRNYARAAVLGGSVFVVGGNLTAGGSHASEGCSVVERMRPGR